MSERTGRDKTSTDIDRPTFMDKSRTRHVELHGCTKSGSSEIVIQISCSYTVVLNFANKFWPVFKLRLGNEFVIRSSSEISLHLEYITVISIIKCAITVTYIYEIFVSIFD